MQTFNSFDSLVTGNTPSAPSVFIKNGVHVGHVNTRDETLLGELMQDARTIELEMAVLAELTARALEDVRSQKNIDQLFTEDMLRSEVREEFEQLRYRWRAEQQRSKDTLGLVLYSHVIPELND